MPELLIRNRRIRVDGVIFDKDGTLVDFRRGYRMICAMRAKLMTAQYGVPSKLAQKAVEICGIALDTGLVDPQGPLCQTSIDDQVVMIANILYQNRYSWNESREIAREILRHADQAVDLNEAARPVPFLRECLMKLKSNGFRIALVTIDESVRTKQVLDQLRIRDFFEVVVTRECVRQTKPDPEAVYYVSRHLGVSPSRLIVVGDTVVDMQMGRAAGVAMTVGILNAATPSSVIQTSADMMIDSLSNIKPV